MLHIYRTFIGLCPWFELQNTLCISVRKVEADYLHWCIKAFVRETVQSAPLDFCPSHFAASPAVRSAQSSPELRKRLDSWTVITLLASLMWFIRSSCSSEWVTQAGSQKGFLCLLLWLGKSLHLVPSSGRNDAMQVQHHTVIKYTSSAALCPTVLFLSA